MKDYLFSIHLDDLLLTGEVFTGLGLAILLWFAGSLDRTANRLISLILTVVSLWLVFVLLTDIRLERYFPDWKRLPWRFTLALGPLLYFYVRKITRQEYKAGYKRLLHFGPLLAELAAQIFHWPLRPALSLLTFFSIIIYLYLSHRAIKDFYGSLKFHDGDRNRQSLRWLGNLLTGFVLLWSAWLCFGIADYFYDHGRLPMRAYGPLYLILSMLVGRMAVKALFRPVSAPSLPKTQAPVKLKQQGTWLRKTVQTNRYYQDPELTLTSLAEKLNLSPHELSRIINTGLHQSFHDFINTYRVEEVIRKMQDPVYDRMNLAGIAYDSGFNAKSTFHRIFKEMTGKSPADYKAGLGKELPVYKLRPVIAPGAIILRHETIPLWSYDKLNRNYMFRYHLKTAWRRFTRDRQFTILNLAGLSTGLAAALLIGLWVNDELRADHFYEKDAQLYQVMTNLKSGQGIQTLKMTPVPLAESMAKEMPEVERAVAVNEYLDGITSSGETHIQAHGWYAGKDFFDVFSYQLIQGNKDQALATENNIVLSQTLAKKMFPATADVIGRTLEWKDPVNKGVFRVSGIFQDPPANATAHFDFLLNIGILLKTDRWAKNWTNSDGETFLILKKGTAAGRFSQKIAGYLKAKDSRVTDLSLFVQQYSAKYLYGNYVNGAPAGGRIAYVRLFSAIALFVLLIACINFMNLSTAEAAGKLKDAGIKKAIGASRGSLIIQHLAQSTLMALVSLCIALVFILLLLPQFNTVTGKHIQFGNILFFMLPAITTALLTGLVAGCYPAFYLSGFKPVTVLKGQLKTSFSELWTRKGLVVFQFSISILFIFGFLIIDGQIRYAQSKNLGYNKDNVLSFQWKGELYNRWNGLLEGKSNAGFEAFLNRLKTTPGVAGVTNMSGNILDQVAGTSGVSWRGQAEDRNYSFKAPMVGYGFPQTLGMKLAAGRSFSQAYHDDYSKIILNETAVKMMGIKDPVGQFLDFNGKSEIIGVVKDFHYGSLHNTIEPLILRFDPTGSTIIIKMQSGKETGTIDELKKLYAEFLPGYTFDYKFMDDSYQALYSSELRVAALSRFFALLAVMISCLGLFGLAAFTAQKRQKEIGIRKVLGASVSQVSAMLSAEFLKLVLVSVIIALPFSWWAMSQWLGSFADRLPVSWWFFVLPVLLTLMLALITVSYQSIKAAMVNPVKSLRAE